MASDLIQKKANFGTGPVFFTAISTILGAILFLRFGWAVGNVGFIGVLGIILLGHLITIPTAMAVAEIATNQKVQGGGAYYIISRSFGLNIGGAVGITLYLSQAVSIAFYVIAFTEAFEPVIAFVNTQFGFEIPKRVIALLFMALLALIVLTKGANFGMKALYGVVLMLGISLLFFFMGNREMPGAKLDLHAQVDNPESFFYVFTIVFPAFTGLAAGLGLSGDLKNPKKSIPRGTIWATLAGLIIYILVAYKLTISATPDELASDQMIMGKIAIWGPIIPIGLAAAALSSALGSILVAPRTLQAIGVDHIFPNEKLNNWIGYGRPGSNEPIRSSVISVGIAFFFVAIGDINFVAEIISMFFMVTYGFICLVSVLEHFAADPAYRPTFKSKWYISLIGAVLSFWVMFKMNTAYAFLSLGIMGIIYYYIASQKRDKQGLANLFRGVGFQLSRQLQVFMQQTEKDEDKDENWRPFVMCISKDSFKRRAAFDMIRWISFKYGFGTYIHFIEGKLTKGTNKESKDVLSRLISLSHGARSKVYLDTIISPSYTSAIAQTIQLQGISGKGNNMILLEFSRTDPGDFPEALKNFNLLKSTHFDICVLNTSYKGFGYKKDIHIWITSQDYENANLMILLAYILLGHPEWNRGIIKIFALYPEKSIEDQRQNLLRLIRSGRLPIAPGNIELIPQEETQDYKVIIEEKSIDADLTIIGFRDKDVKLGIDLFGGFGDIGNIMFVNADKQKEIL